MIKDLFFKDKECPDFFNDYDVLGFDADHCFVKYNVSYMLQQLIKFELQDFHNDFKYPKEVMDTPPHILEMCLNSGVWDIDNDLIL